MLTLSLVMTCEGRGEKKKKERQRSAFQNRRESLLLKALTCCRGMESIRIRTSTILTDSVQTCRKGRERKTSESKSLEPSSSTRSLLDCSIPTHVDVDKSGVDGLVELSEPLWMRMNRERATKGGQRKTQEPRGRGPSEP